MFVNVHVQIKKGEIPVPGAVVYWNLLARAPVALPNYFESVSPREVETDAQGEAVLRLPSATFLANNGIRPATIQIVCREAGLRHVVAVPDEDCDLYDLVGQPPSNLPTIPPLFRGATVWLEGENAPTPQDGRDGDYYLRHNGEAWKRFAGVWSQFANLRGPAGDGNGGASTWDELEGKPSVFPPSPHTHSIGDVVDLATQLAALVASDSAQSTALGIETSARQAHEARTDNPHGVTATQIGAALSVHTHDDRYDTKAQTDAKIAAAVAALVNGAPGALDTLAELAAQLGNDQNALTALTNAVSQEVSDRVAAIAAEVLARSNADTALQNSLSAHTSATNNPHGVTKAQVGLSNVDNTSDANKPVSSATQTALNGKEPTIATGTATQYIRGDKTLATLDKSAVGLGNVDNTSDLNKPISTATQTALNLKADQTALNSEITRATNAENTNATAIAGKVTKGSITSGDLTMATARLLGRSTAGSGAIQEIALGSGLSLAAGTLTAATASPLPSGLRLSVPFGIPMTASAAVVTGSAGAVHYARLWVPRRITVAKVSVSLQVASAGDTAAFGVYDLAGNLLITTGANSTSATGTHGLQYTLPVSVVLDAEEYLFAWTTSSTTPRWNGYILPSVWGLTGAASTTDRLFGNGTNASIAGDLPPTLGPLVTVSGSPTFPLFVLTAA